MLATDTFCAVNEMIDALDDEFMDATRARP